MAIKAIVLQNGQRYEANNENRKFEGKLIDSIQVDKSINFPVIKFWSKESNREFKIGEIIQPVNCIIVYGDNTINEPKLISFNYELYKTGKYKAVYRNSIDEIKDIQPRNNGGFIITNENKLTLPSFINPNGLVWEDRNESVYDVFLIPIENEHKS